jgi:L-serine dehydratase
MQNNSKDISKSFPSIFNDVIGPVMRGPSASHCAASARIGRLLRDLMEGNLKEIIVEFDPNGSLATTHKSHGSDMGLFGGLLGRDLTDEKIVDSPREIVEAGILVSIKINAFGAVHPNTYKITLINDSEKHEVVALSTGVGMVEIISIDGIEVLIEGDYYETLIYFDENADELLNFLSSRIKADYIILMKGPEQQFVEIKSQSFLTDEIIKEIRSSFKVKLLKMLSPVLPVLSSKNTEVPFITCQQMLNFNKDKNLSLWELATHYESARGNLALEQVFERMKEIVLILEKSLSDGIKGTEYNERILGYQSGTFKSRMDAKQLLDGGILNQMILYASALMEVKSAMGIIVAAPTAGACAALPGTCLAAGHAMGFSSDEITKAMLAAGMIGIFIAAHSTFAAELAGCQAECGAGSGMAAASLVSLSGGTLEQAIAAASMALQNTLGMICDPVANRVEVPCLGKNVLAASNAFACANMALANYDPVIPLDEVIEAMDKVGKSLPGALRCTALGGLSVTKTSKELEKRFNF